MNNEYQGVLEDTRSEELKSLDYKADSPEFATAIALNWLEKDPSQWKRYTTRNQDGSGSCVAQGFAKGMETIGKDVYSATPIFSRRQNRPSTGMHLYDASSIAKKLGTTLESLCVSQNLNDSQMDAITLPATPKLIGGYVYGNNKDFYAIAEMVEKYKHCIVTFESNYQEWTSIPQYSGTPVKWGHCVCVVDYVKYQGKEYLVIEDSWGHGATDFDDRRLISKDFVEKRCTGAVSVLPAQEIPVTKYTFTQRLTQGMKNDDVVHLQNALKKLGFMPSGVPSTGYFGPATFQAVCKFQLAYKDEILTPGGFSQPTGNFGPLTMAKLNSLI